MKFVFSLLIVLFSLIKCNAQSTDIFVMPGSDIVRPGSLPRVNLNIGIGHTFQPGDYFKNPLGSELTFAYTYENAGSHGFWHTNYGTHTEALGIMRNFDLSKDKKLGAYTWIQLGLSSFTNTKTAVQNRLYNGEALGLAYHFTSHNGIWAQEQYNKIATVPWYTTTSIGYTFSF